MPYKYTVDSQNAIIAQSYYYIFVIYSAKKYRLMWFRIQFIINYEYAGCLIRRHE